MSGSTVKLSTPQVDDSVAPSNASVNTSRWVIAIFIVGLLTWLCFTYPPVHWRIPDELAGVGALSPREDIEKLEAAKDANAWKNSLMKFGVAGSIIGFVGFFLLGRSGGTIGSGIVTLISGVLFGLAAGAIGLVTRRYLDLDHPIPFISHDARPLFCDIVVFSIVSVLLLMPICVWLTIQSESVIRMKAIPLPLAGILAGITVPFTGAIFLPRIVNTSVFPSSSVSLNLLWFTCLFVFTLIAVLFSGRKRNDPTTLPQTN